MGKATEVRYRDRHTRTLVTEPIPAEAALRWFYGTRWGFKLFDIALNRSALCWLYGLLYDAAWSRQKVARFVTRYNINTDECEYPPQHYRTFNAFFSRRLKTGARPFSHDTDIFCSPGDGKVLVFPNLSHRACLPVKGSTISIDLLLHSPIAAQLYDKGAALVLRLAPQDYHRFHFPDSGVAEPTRTIPGRYHSVNPIALARVPDVFCCNKRTVTDFQSRHFGPIAYIEIGAFRVGSIVQTYVPGEVTKGQEKGYFQFGGSTIIVLFAPDSIVFDADLMEDSAQGLEVAVKAGSHIGVCTP